MTDSAAGPAGPPITGEGAVDQALSGLSDLSSVPVSQHHDRLAQAHEALHQALHPAGDATSDAHGQKPTRP